MAYDPYRERGQRQALQTVPINARADVSGAQAQAGALQDVAHGIQQYGDAIMARDALLADTDARKAFEARTEARNNYFYNPDSGLMNTRGANGVNIREPARARLDEIDEEYARGLSPLAAQEYRKRVSAARVEENRSVDVHSSQQTEKYILEGREASVNTAISNAVLNYTNPELFDKYVDEAVAEQGRMDGLMGTAPEAKEARAKELRSGALKARILRVAVDDPMGAAALLNSNRDTLMPDAQHALDTALEGPVNMATANAALAPFIGTPSKVRRGGPVLPRLSYGRNSGTLRDGLIETAYAIGADPLDLATAVSYETAGTFDPRKAGPTTQWGQHRGLIQWGEPQAGQYGVDFSDEDMALRSQLGTNGAIARYFRDRGFKPGMSGLDLYSTINAGSPGRYRASDANNGGAPGDVQDKWFNQMDDHRANAARLLGLPEGAYTDEARRAPGRQVLTEAGLPITPVNEYLVAKDGPDNAIIIARALDMNPAMLMSRFDERFAGDNLTTVAQYVDQSTRQLGIDAGSQAGQYMDTDAAIEAAMAQPDPKIRALMLQQINTYDALNNKAKDNAQNKAYEEAWTSWKLTGNQNIPLNLQLAMGPGKLASLQSTISATETGALKTDMDVYEGLMQATADPAKMASIDLRDYRAALSESDYRFFTAQQASATSAVAAAEKAADKEATKAKYIDQNTAWSAVDDIFGPIGKIEGSTKDTPETRARLQRARTEYAEKLMAFVEKEGRAPDVTEMRGIATDMVLPIAIGAPSVFNRLGITSRKTRQLWEAEYAPDGERVVPNVSYEAIPTSDRVEIAAQLEAVAGDTPSDKEVALEYGRRRMAAAGEQVARDIRDVPDWAVTSARKKGKSDAETVAFYNAYMAQQYGSP